MRLLLPICSLLAAMVFAASCGRALSKSEGEDKARIARLLEESSRISRTRRDYDRSTKLVIEALELADKSSDKAMKSYALSRLALLDIMTWRDAQGWEHAVESE